MVGFTAASPYPCVAHITKGVDRYPLNTTHWVEASPGRQVWHHYGNPSAI